MDGCECGWVTFHWPIPSPSSQKNEPSALPVSSRATRSPKGFFRLKAKGQIGVMAESWRALTIYTCCWEQINKYSCSEDPPDETAAGTVNVALSHPHCHFLFTHQQSYVTCIWLSVGPKWQLSSQVWALLKYQYAYSRDVSIINILKFKQTKPCYTTNNVKINVLLI